MRATALVNTIHWCRVISTEIDVQPSTATFHADLFDKAMEYPNGVWPKLILVLATEGLRHTIRRIPNSVTSDELAELRRDYPTVVGERGGRTYLSHSTGPFHGHAYDHDYGRWIPGDARH